MSLDDKILFFFWVLATHEVEEVVVEMGLSGMEFAPPSLFHSFHPSTFFEGSAITNPRLTQLGISHLLHTFDVISPLQ